MEELREQPISEPATALNAADERSVVSENGSQEVDLGKFKNTQALLDAYNNLQAEFTKKSQQLSELKQDKANNHEDILNENDEKNSQNEEKIENVDHELSLFLEKNSEAENFSEEIKAHYLDKNQNPFERAWASVVMSHIKVNDNKINDPIINQYILNDETVKNKIIENYLNELNTSRPPIMISSQSGERLSEIKSDNPKTLEEAKVVVGKMFS